MGGKNFYGICMATKSYSLSKHFHINLSCIQAALGGYILEKA